MGEHLALIVRSAAGEQIAIALRGFEGWTRPLIDRVGRLDVVVTVD